MHHNEMYEKSDMGTNQAGYKYQDGYPASLISVATKRKGEFPKKDRYYVCYLYKELTGSGLRIEVGVSCPAHETDHEQQKYYNSAQHTRIHYRSCINKINNYKFFLCKISFL